MHDSDRKHQKTFIHFSYPLFYAGSQREMVFSSSHWAKKQSTPWRGHQSITGSHKDKQDWQQFTCSLTYDNLEPQINPTYMLLVKWEKLDLHIRWKKIQAPHQKAAAGL